MHRVLCLVPCAPARAPRECAEPGSCIHLPSTPPICLGREMRTHFPRGYVSTGLAQNKSNSVRSRLRAVPWRGLSAGRQDLTAWKSTKAPSLLSKSFRLLNGIKQLLLQLFIALVGREIQAVKAGETAEAVNSAANPALPPWQGPPGLSLAGRLW